MALVSLTFALIIFIHADISCCKMWFVFYTFPPLGDNYMGSVRLDWNINNFFSLRYREECMRVEERDLRSA